MEGWRWPTNGLHKITHTRIHTDTQTSPCSPKTIAYTNPNESQQTNRVVAPEDRVEYYRKMFEASFAREPRRVTVLCKVNPSSM